MMSFWKVRFDRKHALLGSNLASRRTANAPTNALNSCEQAPVVSWDRDQTVLKLGCSRVVSRTYAYQLGKQISDLLNEPSVKVLRVDLADCPAVSSEMLSQFTRAHCLASQLGKGFQLENLNASVQEVFNITRLDRLFGMSDAARTAGTQMTS